MQDRNKRDPVAGCQFVGNIFWPYAILRVHPLMSTAMDSFVQKSNRSPADEILTSFFSSSVLSAFHSIEYVRTSLRLLDGSINLVVKK